MRAALAIVLGAVAVTAGVTLAVRPAGAQDADLRDASAGLRVYADDDHVTVWSPSARVRAPLARTLAVSAETSVDVVTAASVDVTSQASPYAFHEERVEGGLALEWTAARQTGISARVVGSGENDFRSLHLGLGMRRELARRNATLDLAYTAALDRVGRAGDDAFWRGRTGHRLVLGLTQILDPRTYLDLVLDGSWQHGYLASPYRYVPVLAADGTLAFQLPEAVPGWRAAAAGLVRVRRALGGHTFVHADYRLYADTWRVVSHTGSLTVAFATSGDRLVIGAEARGYLQGAASFYRAVYRDEGGAPAWRTRDRALGGMRTTSGSLAADVALGADVASAPHLRLAATLIRFHFVDFPLQRGRTASVLSAGVEVPF